MTDVEDRLREIRERLEAATPGPWLWVTNGRDWHLQREGRRVDERPIMRTPDITAHETPRWPWDPRPTREDSVFIANAPTDIAYLLAEIDRLRSQVDDVCDEVSAYVTDDATPAQAVADAIATNRGVSVRHGYAQAREQAAALASPDHRPTPQGCPRHCGRCARSREIANRIRTMTPSEED